MNRSWIVGGFSALGLAACLSAADHANPPDLSRAHTLSAEMRDGQGQLLRPFLASDGAWRLAVKPSAVSPRYLAILKQYEDRRFDAHFGVDVLAVARAARQFAEAGHIVSGASTITMQVARLTSPRNKYGLATKVAQAVRAVQLELRYSKDEILGLYLTLAPFGGNIEGVRAASLAYFGKEPRALTLAESALLVALPQSPERTRPDRHPREAMRARDKVLARLVREAALPLDEVKEAQATPLPPLRLPMPMDAPHLAENLHAKYPARIAIDSTLDGALQRAGQSLALKEMMAYGDGANVAVVAVENSSRNVLAYIGGANYWGVAGHVDLAGSFRSPGSALKPFIYGMAFDDLALHPATLMEDQPEVFGDYAPRNFDGGFFGAVTARDALRMSLNVPAVMVLERVGPVRFTQALEHAGAKIAFPTNDTVASLPVALGGLGITVSDMAMLYSGLAEGGEAKPLRFTKDAARAAQGSRMFGAAADYYLHDILTGAALPDGWAMGQGLKRPRSIGFKTGTAYGYRDAWALGFSNDYTVGVWVGRPDGAPRPDRLGRNDAAPILLRMFDLLPPDKRAPFPAPHDAILVSDANALPASLRHFARDSEKSTASAAPIMRPPAIAFPPDGAVVSLAAPKEPTKTITLKANGGRAPFTWMVNGALLGSYDRYSDIGYVPDGEGSARITVIDADGNSDTSRVRFKKAK